MEQSEFTDHTITFNNTALHVVEAGHNNADTIVFLHGWPEDWTEWQEVMKRASATHHVIAVDLPGIGGSSPIEGGEKMAMAKQIHDALATLQLGHYTIVGHDAGAMTAYAYLRQFASELRAAVLMDSVMPGLEPWSKVLANRYVWHFAFHNTTQLPEVLVAGHERLYFDHYFDMITKDPATISDAARDHYAAAYATPETLHAGFDWYRGFTKDAEANSRDTAVIDTPLLYLRGEFEGGNMDEYVAGFRAAGISSLTTALIPGSGHYAPEENPEKVWEQ